MVCGSCDGCLAVVTNTQINTSSPVEHITHAASTNLQLSLGSLEATMQRRQQLIRLNASIIKQQCSDSSLRRWAEQFSVCGRLGWVWRAHVPSRH
jgi:hypothetical protein